MLFYLTKGDSGVGKSNLMLRFTDNRYQSAHDVTIGVEFGARILSVQDDKTNATKNLKCQIWDTAGQESFKSITRYIFPAHTPASGSRGSCRSYYRGATGALLVYDITRPATFTSATSWLSDLRAHADPNIAIGMIPGNEGVLTIVVLVGNKADLSHDRKVTTEEARKWAEENDLSVCVESSAKSGDGVEDAFQRVAEEVFRKIRDGVFDLTDKVHFQPAPHPMM